MDKVIEKVREMSAKYTKSYIIAALQIAFFVSYEKANQVYAEAMGV